MLAATLLDSTHPGWTDIKQTRHFRSLHPFVAGRKNAITQVLRICNAHPWLLLVLNREYLKSLIDTPQTRNPNKRLMRYDWRKNALERAFVEAGLKVIMPGGASIEVDDEFEVRE